MKRFYYIIACFLISVCMFSQSYEVISETPTSVTIRKIEPVAKVYQYVERPVQTVTTTVQTTNVEDKTGRIGIGFHGNYSFKDEMDFGANLFYLFGGKAKGNFGLNFGYDWSDDLIRHFPEDNYFFTKFWDVRAGIVLGKFVGIGYVYGKTHDYYYNETVDDYGAYANLNFPIAPWFGIFMDGKYTKYQHWSVGGGIMFMLPTKI